MDNSRFKKEQLAKRLGVNVEVLEQYLQLKRIEGSGRAATPKIEQKSRAWEKSLS